MIFEGDRLFYWTDAGASNQVEPSNAGIPEWPIKKPITQYYYYYYYHFSNMTTNQRIYSVSTITT